MVNKKKLNKRKHEQIIFSYRYVISDTTRVHISTTGYNYFTDTFYDKYKLQLLWLPLKYRTRPTLSRIFIYDLIKV